MATLNRLLPGALILLFFGCGDLSGGGGLNGSPGRLNC